MFVLKRKLRVLLSVCLVLFLSLSVYYSQGLVAAEKSPTPPPPSYTNPFGVFDPNHVYLYDGTWTSVNRLDSQNRENYAALPYICSY